MAERRDAGAGDRAHRNQMCAEYLDDRARARGRPHILHRVRRGARAGSFEAGSYRARRLDRFDGRGGRHGRGRASQRHAELCPQFRRGRMMQIKSMIIKEMDESGKGLAELATLSAVRSEARRVGKEWVSTWKSRWWA